MPKWKSPIFSDIRNAIGDNVIFSQWKGRPYFRAYVKPANPDTNGQKSERATLTNIIKRWQTIAADEDVKTLWNAEALPFVVSGYNLFTKWGRSSKLSVTPSSGAAPLTVTITYTLGIPAAKAGILQFNGTTWSIAKDKGTLSMTPNSTVQISGLEAGTYYFYIADMDILKAGDEAPQAYQAMTMWKANHSAGTSDECKATATGG